MAAAFWLKSRMVVPTFSVRLVLKTFCVATASVKKASTDVQAQKKEKKKDLAKMEEYEEYRFGVQRLREAFKEEYNAKIAKERRRLEEINRGSYSPYEQHKKAVQDMMKYNEEKSTMRKNKEEQRERRLKAHREREKEASDTKRLEKNREFVLEVIEESKSFVTMENLEEKIQEVLSNETNHNFALTSDGSKIISQEPPSNLGIQGPGPVAYQGAGVKFYNRDQKTLWKTRDRLADVNEMDESDSSESSDSDSESSDDDLVKDPDR